MNLQCPLLGSALTSELSVTIRRMINSGRNDKILEQEETRYNFNERSETLESEFKESDISCEKETKPMTNQINNMKKEDLRPEFENDFKQLAVPKDSPIQTITDTSVVSVANLESEAVERVFDSMMSKVGTAWACNVCGKTASRFHMREHIEGKHVEGLSYTCDLCGSNYR